MNNPHPCPICRRMTARPWCCSDDCVDQLNEINVTRAALEGYDFDHYELRGPDPMYDYYEEVEDGEN